MTAVRPCWFFTEKDLSKRLAMLIKNLLVPISLSFFLALGARADEMQIQQDSSIFAIVTHKAGLAKGQAHNHLVAAKNYSVRLEAEAGGVDAVFEIDLMAADLVVDAPDLQTKWFPRLKALGILSEPFADVSAKDRDKIRQSALGRGQLDAAKFPSIKARIAGLVEKTTAWGEEELAHEAMLVFDVHGRSKTRPVAANILWQDGRLRVEAAGTFLFSDFDIKPFSAFFGAVKNTDEFHVYVYFEAEPGL